MIHREFRLVLVKLELEAWYYLEHNILGILTSFFCTNMNCVSMFERSLDWKVYFFTCETSQAVTFIALMTWFSHHWYGYSSFAKATKQEIANLPGASIGGCLFPAIALYTSTVSHSFLRKTDVQWVVTEIAACKNIHHDQYFDWRQNLCLIL